MGVKGFESSPGVVLRFMGPVDPFVGLFEALGGAPDGVGVASRPSLS
jgi:hypothetical protein